MHKKCLFFILAFNCVVVAGSKRPQIVPNVQMKYRSFDELPEDLVNGIPLEMRANAQKKFIEKENAKLCQDIEEHYKDVLGEELEAPGSIDQKLIKKYEENNCSCGKEKQKVCTCNRGQGILYNDNTDTQVKQFDTVLENNNHYKNNQYILAADKLIKRHKTIKEEVDKAAIEYKKKAKLLSKIINSLDKCGLDKQCNLNNGYADFHLTQEYRNTLSTTIINKAIKECGDKDAATEEELRGIWEKSSKLKPCIKEIAGKNERIDYLINPDNQQEIEEKKKEIREKEEQGRQQRAEEESKKQKNN